jgi:hypothetical protein
MTTSLHMALLALGVPESECSVQTVNKVVGAMPLYGAAWEPLLAAANHYGMRSTLTMPSTVRQLKSWTDAGSPVIIGWNPEDREWSHASLVFHVTEDEEHGFLVHVADPNIPDPDETVRIVPKKEFYSKWYEKSPQGFMIRRPACVIEREVTPEGRQVMASKRYPWMTSPRTAVGAQWEEVHVDDDGNFFTRSRSGRVKPGSGLKTGIYFDTRGEILRGTTSSEPATKEHDDRYWREFYKLWVHLAEMSGDPQVDLLSKYNKQGFSQYPMYVTRSIPNKANEYDHTFPVSLAQLRRMVEDQHNNLSVVTPEELEQFKRVWGSPGHYEFPENMVRLHGKKAFDKWRGMNWILLQRRTFVDDDPYRDRNQSRTFEVYMVTEEGRKVLGMDASDLPDYVPAKGKPRPLSQNTELGPDPVSKPKTPQKTVVDSALSEKFAILDRLIAGGFPQAQAAARAVKDAYEAGGKPTEDQLKTLRNMMYRSKMKAEADQFRVATGVHSQSDSAMARRVAASYLAKLIVSAKLAVSAKLPDRKRADINNSLVKAGLDGNGRFNKPEAAYSRALDVLADYGIELDTVVSSHLFKNRPTVVIPIRVAFSNPSDPFSPISISNSMLHLQSTELRPNVFEAVVYMS